MDRRLTRAFLGAALLVAALAACGSENGDAASPAAVSTQDSRTTESGVIPEISVPADVEDVQLLLELNKAISEASQQPAAQRMTSEEINSRIRSRIEETRR